ncbi:MAG: hypothetical protein QM765_47410 [Myxococcales bacterium]
MRTALVALLAGALLLGTGCFMRPWAIEESDRIDRLLEHEVDDADGEAFAGVSTPRCLSPTAVAEVEHRSSTAQTKKAKKGNSKGSKDIVSFSSLTPGSSKSGKKR